MKKLLLVMFFCCISMAIISNTTYADAPHRYTLAKISIEMIDGSIKEGYSPLYALYFNNNEEDKVIGGANLKGQFTAELKNIMFVDKIYTLPKIGIMIAQEEIKEVSLSSVNKVIFKEWIKEYSGEVGLITMPLKDIVKVSNNEIMNIETITGYVSDMVFINLNRDISKDTLKMVARYSPFSISESLGDNFYDIYSLVLYGINNKDKDYAVEPIIDKVTNALEKENKELAVLRNDTGNKEIDQYMSLIKIQVGRRIMLYKALLLYMQVKDIGLIKQFVTEIDKPGLQDTMKNNVKAISNNSDMLENIAIIIKSLNDYLIIPIDQNKYDDMLNRNNIITVVFCWD